MFAQIVPAAEIAAPEFPDQIANGLAGALRQLRNQERVAKSPRDSIRWPSAYGASERGEKSCGEDGFRNKHGYPSGYHSGACGTIG